MKNTFRVIVTFLLAVAIIQWLGIGERIYHAFVQWWKFKDYSDNGRTTMNRSMVMATYVISTASIAISFVLTKTQSDLFVVVTGRLAAILLMVGVVALTVLLASPFGEFR